MHRRSTARHEREGRVPVALCREIAFIAMVVGRAGVYLVSMNHAFLCHATWFSVSPLIVAGAVVAVGQSSARPKNAVSV